MNPFKIGDRVRAYWAEEGSTFCVKSEIIKINGDEITLGITCNNEKGELRITRVFHYKQCRRLTKKFKIGDQVQVLQTIGFEGKGEIINNTFKVKDTGETIYKIDMGPNVPNAVYRQARFVKLWREE